MEVSQKYYPCKFSNTDLTGFGTSISCTVIPNVSDWPESLFIQPDTMVFYLNETYFDNLQNNLVATLTYDLPSDLKTILTSFLRTLVNIKRITNPVTISNIKDKLLPYGFDIIG